MEVCKELKILANEFNKKGHELYIVGGYVRDYLLGITSKDIDIVSDMDTSEVEKICKKLKAKTSNINSHLGTIGITYNSQKFEYTRFREESYSNMGTHTPDTINFVSELKLDSNRRDFTINTIYYNILTEQIINPHGGVKDLENKVLRTTLTPHKTLSDDGLRILRAVRFASTFNLKIEKKTFKALKVFTPLLNKISKERILKELQSVVTADYIHKISNTIFLKLCNKLKLPMYIFNSTLSTSKPFSKKDVSNFYHLSKNARLIGFYMLILKNYFITYLDSNQLGYSINQLLGVNGLKESNNNILLTEKLYRVYQNLLYGKDTLNASINYLTFSDTEREIIDTFLPGKAKQILSDNISFAKDNKLPLSIHELEISAKDLIEEGIEKVYISKILNTLYNQVLNMTVANVQKDLINLAKEIHNTFKKFKE